MSRLPDGQSIATSNLLGDSLDRSVHVLDRFNQTQSSELWRERPFTCVLPEPDGGGDALWTGSFDRVVLGLEGVLVVAAELIDFKTDRVEGQRLEASVERYRPQLEAYRRVLAHLTGLAEGAIRARLLFLHQGVVLDL